MGRYRLDEPFTLEPDVSYTLAIRDERPCITRLSKDYEPTEGERVVCVRNRPYVVHWLDNSNRGWIYTNDPDRADALEETR